MSSMSAAQFGPYFHGSNTEFQPGDTLKPPSETGNTYWGKIHSSDMERVYSVGAKEIDTLEAEEQMENAGLSGMKWSKDAPEVKAEKLAWTFATQRVSQEPGRRSAVYEVEPDKSSLKVPTKEDVPGEVISRSAKVNKRIDIAPGRQGTIPQLNWNQFALHTGKQTTAFHSYPDIDGVEDKVDLDYNHPPDPPKYDEETAGWGRSYVEEYRGTFLGEDRETENKAKRKQMMDGIRDREISPKIQPRLF